MILKKDRINIIQACKLKISDKINKNLQCDDQKKYAVKHVINLEIIWWIIKVFFILNVWGPQD